MIFCPAMFVMMFGYTHDMSFMARKTPPTDVMDDICSELSEVGVVMLS